MTFKRLVFLFLIVFLNASFLFAESEKEKQQIEKEKRAIYENVSKDPNFKRMADEIRQDPGNKAKMDNLLIQLPLSPLDMFQIRMESQFREYVVPKEVVALHQRWLALHPEVAVSEEVGQAIAAVAAVVVPQYQVIALATVGTNRDLPSADYDGEIQLAVNKNNNNQMVASANSWGCEILSVFNTTDGGGTWNSSCAPSVATFGLSCPAGNVPLGSDPAVYWDNLGSVFLNYMLLCCDAACQTGTGNPTSSLVVAKSTTAGATWTGHGVIVNNLGNPGAGFDDKQFYIVDNTPTSPFYGRHYQCWDVNNNGKIAWSTSGTSWNIVDTPKGTAGDLELGCEMAVGKNGTVHMVFDGLTCGATCSAEKSYYTRSTNGGVSWSTPVLVKNHTVVSFHTNAKIPPQNNRGVNPFGAIDVDNSGGGFDGTLYFSYSGSSSTATMPTSDVYVTRSLDNGATWSAGVKVNDDGTSTAQFHPFLVVDQTNGAVVVGWHDARNDTTNNRKVDYYISRSVNQGVTWEANTKVSQPSTAFPGNTTISYSDENSTDNSGRNPNQYGEYLGVDAHAGKAWMAWTDTRSYYPTAGANAPQKEDVAFATVDFGSSGDTVPPTTSITAPSNGATVSGTITVSANASDNVGVTNVEFYAGASLIGSDSTSPYSISWDTTTVANGTYNLTSKAYDAAANSGTSSAVSVTVNNVAGPPALTATYNSTLKAPSCASGGKSCDTGASLINSRGTMSPAEPNQPNTINTSCADGSSGTYHSDESLDRLLIATNDSTALAGGKVVTISATAWCWGTADSVDLYYTSNASTPSWTFIGTQTCTSGGAARTFTASYTLPSTGTQHAIRGQFRYQGTAGTGCTSGSYNDRDDLIFGVNQAADTTPPTTSITAPANGATVSGTAVTVSANASDNVGVTRVEFYLDGTTLLATDTTSPYSISWNTTTATNGSHNLTSRAFDAANNSTTSTAVNVTVNNVAAGDLFATFSATYQAPACPGGGKSCDTGATLINGRGTMASGNEPNQPNTINDSCADGNSGTYHVDESIDRMKIATNDGTALASGKAVTITFTVYCYSTADRIDVYRTATAATPGWTLIGTQQCTAAGVRTFTATYTLPTGTNQAVRGNFRYNGAASSCSTGSYDDHDDLVFGVQ